MQSIGKTVQRGSQSTVYDNNNSLNNTILFYTLNATNTHLMKKVTGIWLAYSNYQQ